MVTKNVRNLIVGLLQSAASSRGNVPVTDVSGRRWYASGAFGTSGFPCTRNTTLTLNASAAGISIGAGGTAATEKDHQLEQTITGGVTMTMSDIKLGGDEVGNPWVRYRFTVSNTGTAPVTIREIGYKQNILCGIAPGVGGSPSAKTCLLDRTVLASPVTVSPGDAAIIDYKLQTDAFSARTVSGVEIVGWEWGTDEQIAAMLDAARGGTIDLQQDAHWSVGDIRRVRISAFTSGNVNHNAQDVGLVISSFADDYGCGCVMQFDFINSLAQTNRMHDVSGTVNYGVSEMKTTTLPALVEALPGWLKNRLLTFNVKAGSGSTVTTVSGNKLALRAEVEVTGGTEHSRVGEGTQAALYATAAYRKRSQGLDDGNNNSMYWTRSATSSYTCILSSGESDGGKGQTASNGVAPFGCL